jgi:hypothetical protein
MLQNEHQYKVTKAQLKNLEQNLSILLENRDLASNSHPRLMRMQSAALEEQIQMMYREIAEYDNLRDGNVKAALNSQLSKGKVVTIDLDEPQEIDRTSTTPMQHAGILDADPTFDDWMDKLADIRRSANEINDDEL